MPPLHLEPLFAALAIALISCSLVAASDKCSAAELTSVASLRCATRCTRRPRARQAGDTLRSIEALDRNDCAYARAQPPPPLLTASAHRLLLTLVSSDPGPERHPPSQQHHHFLHDMEWAQDAEVESTPLSTTGGHTWAAARRLATYLSAAPAELGLQHPGIRVLELGAGTGWLGVTVARNLPAAALVCLTEQEGGLGWLNHNVQLNATRGLPLGHVRVQACDWQEYGDGGGGGDRPGQPAAAAAGQPEQQQNKQHAQQQSEQQQQPSGAVDLRSTHWDVILGSDLIYNEIGSRCLPKVLAALAAPDTQVRVWPARLQPGSCREVSLGHA